MWFVAVHCIAVQCGAPEFRALQCSSMHFDTLLCNAVRCNAVLCHAVQFDAVPCNAVRCRRCKDLKIRSTFVCSEINQLGVVYGGWVYSVLFSVRCMGAGCTLYSVLFSVECKVYSTMHSEQ